MDFIGSAVFPYTYFPLHKDGTAAFGVAYEKWGTDLEETCKAIQLELGLKHLDW